MCYNCSLGINIIWLVLVVRRVRTRVGELGATVKLMHCDHKVIG
jgi:hypothetical protein